MSQLSYHRTDLARLFGEMSATYGRMNLVTSFGFAHWWRLQCLRALEVKAGAELLDLMAGRGEASSLAARHHPDLVITAVDFCPEMCARARNSPARNRARHFNVLCEDARGPIPGRSFDRVICTFGLKTLDNDGLTDLARTVFSVLRDGGQAAFVEIYLPSHRLLRLGYSFYIRWVIPVIGRLFLGNPDCYRKLHQYTADFVQRDIFAQQLQSAGFLVSTRPLFLGCARLFVAGKPHKASLETTRPQMPCSK